MDKDINFNISLKTHVDIDLAAHNFIQLIKDSANTASFHTHSPKSAINKELPHHIKSLINEKRRARAKWQNTHYNFYKQIYNKLANNLKRQLKKFKSEQYERYLTSLNPMDNSLWKATKRLTKIKERIPPLLKEDGSLAVSDHDKAELFAKHLAKTFIHHDIIPEPSHINIVDNFLNPPLPMALPIKPLSPGEIQASIKTLP